MSNSIELAKELKIEIEKEPLIIEYRRVKNLIDTDDELNRLKKDIALAKAHKAKKLHLDLLDKYNSHPLIVNLETLKEEVNDYLLEISNIVNKK